MTCPSSLMQNSAQSLPLPVHHHCHDCNMTTMPPLQKIPCHTWRLLRPLMCTQSCFCSCESCHTLVPVTLPGCNNNQGQILNSQCDHSKNTTGADFINAVISIHLQQFVSNVGRIQSGAGNATVSVLPTQRAVVL